MRFRELPLVAKSSQFQAKSAVRGTIHTDGAHVISRLGDYQLIEIVYSSKKFVPVDELFPDRLREIEEKDFEFGVILDGVLLFRSSILGEAIDALKRLAADSIPAAVPCRQDTNVSLDGAKIVMVSRAGILKLARIDSGNSPAYAVMNADKKRDGAAYVIFMSRGQADRWMNTYKYCRLVSTPKGVFPVKTERKMKERQKISADYRDLRYRPWSSLY